MYFVEALLVLTVSLAVVVLVRLVCYLVMSPVRADGCEAEVTLRVEGEIPDFEFVIRSAEKLAARGGIRLVVIDCGMDDATRYIAEKMAYGGRFKIVDE